ncbi:multicopper oxidase domain-containing protein [Caldibacillus debilis]|nr:multicopper oxidase domain-containing protein [Caldibacillus debilis]
MFRNWRNREYRFFANDPGNWTFHCHKPPHVLILIDMGGMPTVVRYVQ